MDQISLACYKQLLLCLYLSLRKLINEPLKWLYISIYIGRKDDMSNVKRNLLCENRSSNYLVAISLQFINAILF